VPLIPNRSKVFIYRRSTVKISVLQSECNCCENSFCHPAEFSRNLSHVDMDDGVVVLRLRDCPAAYAGLDDAAQEVCAILCSDASSARTRPGVHAICLVPITTRRVHRHCPVHARCIYRADGKELCHCFCVQQRAKSNEWDGKKDITRIVRNLF